MWEIWKRVKWILKKCHCYRLFCQQVKKRNKMTYDDFWHVIKMRCKGLRRCLYTVVYHSHLGEVDQVVLSVVGRPLLDEGQVCQVHSQIGNTGRVTAEDTRQVRGRQQLYRRMNTKGEYTKPLQQNMWTTAGDNFEYLLLQSFSQVFESALWWHQLL